MDVERYLDGRLVLVVAVALAAGCGQVTHGAKKTPPPPERAFETERGAGKATAVLAGGCFWCTEAVFEDLQGVQDVVSGYAGGKASTASYYTVARGATDHAEAIKITYDPKAIGYGELLHVFFSVAHDPTQLNRQGPDVGRQYRSAVFYESEAQKEYARAYIEQLNESEVFSGEIATTLEPLEGFYPAEPEHQDYVEKHPENTYVQYNAIPKVEKLRAAFPELLKGAGGASKQGGTDYDKLSEAEWRERLTEEEFYILREAGTERAYTGDLLDEKRAGAFVCAGCGQPLFASETKFESGTGWPSFYALLDEKHIEERPDNTLGMRRTEVVCARCDGHLGHVFNDGPAPTGLRYCINSAALDFEAKTAGGSGGK